MRAAVLKQPDRAFRFAYSPHLLPRHNDRGNEQQCPCNMHIQHRETGVRADSAAERGCAAAGRRVESEEKPCLECGCWVGHGAKAKCVDYIIKLSILERQCARVCKTDVLQREKRGRDLDLAGNVTCSVVPDAGQATIDRLSAFACDPLCVCERSCSRATDSRRRVVISWRGGRGTAWQHRASAG